MPRVSQQSVLADRQDPAQPALFDDQQRPMEAAALEAIRARRYEFKGVRLVGDDTKAERLVELITLKWGVKKISREMNISPHTVRAARRLLVTQGKLAPYKQRIVEAMEDAIEAGVYAVRDAIEDGTMKAGQIPVPLAIMFDKRALAMGEPTSIGGRAVQAEGLRVEDINAYFEQLPSCNPGVTTDLPSTDKMPKPQQIEIGRGADVTLDVSQGQPGTGSGLAVHPPGPDRTDAKAGEPGDQDRAGGRGGRDVAAVD